MEEVHLAVNSILMRGLELNRNLIEVGSRFVRQTTTAPCYRLWSIKDLHPAMVRVRAGGARIQVEVWALPAAGLAAILLKEPRGLCVGRIDLEDGAEVLGVLAEPILCEGMFEITRWGGWRQYLANRQGDQSIN